MKTIDILLVDDDEVDRMTIMRMLESCDFDTNVAQACDGQSGIDAFETANFDCVLLDYRLPDMDGAGVLTQMANGSDPGTAVIMLTGQGNESIAAEALKNGA